MVTRGVQRATFVAQLEPAAEAMLQIDPPSGIRAAASSARCFGAAKLTSMVSTSEKSGGPGTPAQLNREWMVPPMTSTASVTASASRRSTW